MKVNKMILGMEASEIISYAARHGFSQEEIHALLRAMVHIEAEEALTLFGSWEASTNELNLI